MKQLHAPAARVNYAMTITATVKISHPISLNASNALIAIAALQRQSIASSICPIRKLA